VQTLSATSPVQAVQVLVASGKVSLSKHLVHTAFAIVPRHFTQTLSTAVSPVAQAVQIFVATVPTQSVHFLVASGKV